MKRYYSLIALVILAWLRSAPASAEPLTADSVARMTLDELLSVDVTVGSAFPKDSLTSGATVDRVSHDDWTRRGSRLTFEALEHLPSMDVQRGFGGFPYLRLRNSPAGNGVALKVDRTPVSGYSNSSSTDMLPNLELGVIDSMQVIRGAGSALHGSDAFHGLVQLSPFRSEQDVVEASARGGSFHYRQTDLRIGKELGDSWRTSTAGSYSGQTDEEISQSFTDSNSGLPVSIDVPAKYHSASITQRLHRGDFDILFLWSEFETDSFQDRGEIPGIVQNGALSDGEVTTRLVSVSDDLSLGSTTTLSSNLFYWQGDRVWDEGIMPGSIGQNRAYSIFRSKDERAGGEFILKRELTDQVVPIQVATGYSFDWSHVDRNEFYLSTTPPMSTDSEGKMRRLHSGIFELDAQFLDGDLLLTAGGRVDEYSDFGNHFSPRTSIVYRYSADSSLRANYGHAFRAPAATEQTDFPGLIQGGGSTLDPEIIDTFEVGFTFDNNKLSAGITGFISIVEDGIIPVLSGDPSLPFRFANVEEREIMGVELALSYREKHNFKASLSTSYNHGEQTEPQKSHNDFVSFPAWLIDSEVTKWFFDQQIEFTVINRIEIKQASRNTPGTTSFRNDFLPDFWRTDARVAWNIKDSPFIEQLFIEARNLLDRDEISPSFLGVQNGIPEPGISAIAGIKVSL